MGQAVTRSPSPREALASALGDAIGKAITAGDTHAARVAYEALGRLMDEPGSAAPVASLSVARGRGKLGQP